MVFQETDNNNDELTKKHYENKPSSTNIKQDDIKKPIFVLFLEDGCSLTQTFNQKCSYLQYSWEVLVLYINIFITFYIFYTSQPIIVPTTEIDTLVSQTSVVFCDSGANSAGRGLAGTILRRWQQQFTLIFLFSFLKCWKILCSF